VILYSEFKSSLEIYRDKEVYKRRRRGNNTITINDDDNRIKKEHNKVDT